MKIIHKYGVLDEKLYFWFQSVLCWQSSLRLVVTQKNIASHFGSHINSLRENVPFNTLVTVLIDVVASL